MDVSAGWFDWLVIFLMGSDVISRSCAVIDDWLTSVVDVGLRRHTADRGS